MVNLLLLYSLYNYQEYAAKRNPEYVEAYAVLKEDVDRAISVKDLPMRLYKDISLTDIYLSGTTVTYTIESSNGFYSNEFTREMWVGVIGSGVSSVFCGRPYSTIVPVKIQFNFKDLIDSKTDTITVKIKDICM